MAPTKYSGGQEETDLWKKPKSKICCQTHFITHYANFLYILSVRLFLVSPSFLSTSPLPSLHLPLSFLSSSNPFSFPFPFLFFLFPLPSSVHYPFHSLALPLFILFLDPLHSIFLLFPSCCTIHSIHVYDHIKLLLPFPLFSCSTFQSVSFHPF